MLMSNRPYVIAHRGISGRYPENTLLAFEKAVDAGSDWIELDVHTTADDIVIVSHDTQADRCTDGHGYFKTMTLPQVKQLDAGRWLDESFAGQRIPTLEETLDLIGDSRVRLCIEIKGDDTGDYLRTAWGTVHLLQKHDFLRYTIISSFNHECLRAVKTWEPLIATSLDPEPQDGSLTPWELCQQVLGFNINSMQHKYETLTPETIDEAHQHGFSLWTWTVNEPEDMRRMIEMGVDAIMTDHADVLRQIVDEMAGPMASRH
jgi:glycerophosphoryl diester phosphodiesterase